MNDQFQPLTFLPYGESVPKRGRQRFEAACRILQFDYRGAIARKDWNIAVRRAQESSELAWMGVLDILRVSLDQKTSHQLTGQYANHLKDSLPVMILRQGGPLSDGQEIRALVRLDTMQIGLFRFDEDAAVQVVAMSLVDLPGLLSMKQDGDDHVLYAGSKELIRFSGVDFGLGGGLVEATIDDDQFRDLRKAVNKLSARRDSALFFEREFSESEAEEAGIIAEKFLAFFLERFGIIGASVPWIRSVSTHHQATDGAAFRS